MMLTAGAVRSLRAYRSLLSLRPIHSALKRQMKAEKKQREKEAKSAGQKDQQASVAAKKPAVPNEESLDPNVSTEQHVCREKERERGGAHLHGSVLCWPSHV